MDYRNTKYKSIDNLRISTKHLISHFVLCVIAFCIVFGFYVTMRGCQIFQVTEADK